MLFFFCSVVCVCVSSGGSGGNDSVRGGNDSVRGGSGSVRGGIRMLMLGGLQLEDLKQTVRLMLRLLLY